MKKIISIALMTLMSLSLFGCSQEEPSMVKTYETNESEFTQEGLSVVKTYEVTDLETALENFDNDELVTMVR